MEHVRLRIVEANGRLEVREVHFLDIGEEITSQRLRGLNIGALGGAAGTSAAIAAGAKPPAPLSPPGGRGYGDEFYKQVATAYRWALANQQRPVRSIAESAGVPRSTAARWVKEARHRKMLGETRQGKASKS